MAPPLRLSPRPERPLPPKFHHGTHPPFAIRWFGSSALIGHLRHLVASVLASGSVDPRDWMRAQAPAKILRSVSRVLRGAEGASTLTEALGRPVWIDFIADTGDDRDVSQAVARMVFREYAVGDRVLPRGDLLVFGGDTAYPIASAFEIFRRLTAPYNEVLREVSGAAAEGRRVLLGVPGNHDWYDGLDGFARLFRRSAEPTREDEIDPLGSPKRRARKARSRAGAVAKGLHLDEVGASLHLVQGAVQTTRAFLKGEGLQRIKRLGFLGYEAVQESSYFALHLSPGLDLWAVDRQLRTVDFRQRSYFARRKEQVQGARILFVASDPALAFGEPKEHGMRSLKACDLRLDRDAVFYLTGDTHHYERRCVNRSMHVIAGGGGAFLHGTRIRLGPGGPSAAAYPDAPASRALAVRVPLRMMLGEAGFLPHGVFFLLCVAQMAVVGHGVAAEGVTATILAAAFIAGFYFNAAHHRQHPRLVTAVAVPFGAFMGLLPEALRLVLPGVVPALAGKTAIALVYAFIASFLFGLFLTTCAILGIENEQAFAALGHPGFKHCVRLCVHVDGTVEGWVIGKDDPLAPGTEPELIDTFRWGR